ncbi:MAG: hypothetical protein ACRDHL_10650 [Candidatus Promineifilaceae bacterium]
MSGRSGLTGPGGRGGRLLAVLLLATGMALAAGVREAGAHSPGKLQLSAAAAGPYRLSVWTAPDPATADEVHVTAAVSRAEDAMPVLGAEVEVRLRPADGQSQTYAAAAGAEDEANKFLYEAAFEDIEPGSYDVTLTVAGPDGGLGQAGFGLEVIAAGGIEARWLAAAGMALLALALWRARRPEKDAPRA